VRSQDIRPDLLVHERFGVFLYEKGRTIRELAMTGLQQFDEINVRVQVSLKRNPILREAAMCD
jgi:hypothetical protein